MPEPDPARPDRATRRVMLLTMAPVLSGEAPGVQVANMAQAFADLGHEVTVVAPTGSQPTDPGALLGFEPTFASIALSRRTHRGQSYLHAARIARLVRGADVDLLYSRNLRASVLPAVRGVPTILEAHSLTSLSGRQDRWFLGRLLAAPGLLGIVAISQGLADDLRDELGVPAERMMVAHDAVRIAPGSESADRPPDAGARDGADGLLHAGYTGALFAGRGIELLLDVAERAPWLRLHLVGGPPAIAEDLRRRVASSVLAERVMVHGVVTPERARAMQRGFDVLVAPFERHVITDSGVDTARWMSPMKIFEYMASGRPIVTSDLPVLREVLRPEVEALMVAPGDAGALLGALDRLRDDGTLRARLAASAFERARTEFTWDIRVRSILDRFSA